MAEPAGKLARALDIDRDDIDATVAGLAGVKQDLDAAREVFSKRLHCGEKCPFFYDCPLASQALVSLDDIGKPKCLMRENDNPADLLRFIRLFRGGRQGIKAEMQDILWRTGKAVQENGYTQSDMVRYAELLGKTMDRLYKDTRDEQPKRAVKVKIETTTRRHRVAGMDVEAVPGMVDTTDPESLFAEPA